MSVFFINLGFCGPVVSELWSLKKGLQLALNKNITDLKIEMDASEAIQLLNNNIDHCNPCFNLINDCRLLLRRLHVTKIRHIFREANRCADLLAKEGRNTNDAAATTLLTNPMGGCFNSFPANLDCLTRTCSRDSSHLLSSNIVCNLTF